MGAITFTRYSFEIDGPAFARYMRDQLEQELLRSGKLPQGISLQTAHTYNDMIGEGELWVDSRGMPLRQIIHTQFPPGRYEQVEMQVTTDFSLPDEDENKERTWLGLRSLNRYAREQLSIAFGFLGVMGLVFMNRKSKKLYAVLSLAVIFSMLVGPLIQSQQVSAFYEELTSRQAEQEAKDEEQREARRIQQQLLTSDWDPHQEPSVVSIQLIPTILTATQTTMG